MTAVSPTTLLVACSVLISAPPADQAPPRPILAWPAGPLEARVAFATAVGPDLARQLVGAEIPFREPARPGVEPRSGTLRVAAARAEDDGRTLVLAADPHPRIAIYSFKLPGDPAPIPYDLSGVDAAWDDGTDGALPSYTGWWPHVDPEAVRAAAPGSAEHARALALLARPGRLVLRSLLALPRGRNSVVVESSGPVDLLLGDGAAEAVAGPDGTYRAALEFSSTGEPAELNLTARTGVGGKALSLHLTSRVDGGEARPLPRPALTVPWAPAGAAPAAVASPVPDLSGGDRARGEVVFRSEAAKCATCHRVGGQGGVVGPALDGLAGRDPSWVYRNVAEPSSEIHPDYVAYTVARKSGQVAVGVVRADGPDAIRVVDAAAQVAVIPRADVEELRPSATSIMPVGLPGAIGEAGMRDLIAYLTATKHAPPR